MYRAGTAPDSRCGWDNFPRGRAVGWDYNGKNFQIFGNCLPTSMVYALRVVTVLTCTFLGYPLYVGNLLFQLEICGSCHMHTHNRNLRS